MINYIFYLQNYCVVSTVVIVSSHVTMAAGALPLVMFTLIWLGVGAVAPYFVPAGPHKRLIQLSLGLTGACCW